jgi:DNA-binding NtrC family response regulator
MFQGVSMKRRKIDPETKMAAVLDGQKGASTSAAICRTYQVSETLFDRMKLGAYDYLLKPFDLEALSLTIEKLLQVQTLALENLILKERGATITRFENLVGQSPAMLKLFETMVDVAQTDRTALITGETGTGKELMEGQHIARVLATDGGNMSKVAKVLRINRTTFYNEIKKSGLAP